MVEVLHFLVSWICWSHKFIADLDVSCIHSGLHTDKSNFPDWLLGHFTLYSHECADHTIYYRAGDSMYWLRTACWHIKLLIAGVLYFVFSWMCWSHKLLQGWRFHVLTQDCMLTHHTSLVVRRGSPFLPRMNVLIAQIIEAGLITKWERDYTPRWVSYKNSVWIMKFV